jgi:hypothetical protein
MAHGERIKTSDRTELSWPGRVMGEAGKQSALPRRRRCGHLKGHLKDNSACGVVEWVLATNTHTRAALAHGSLHINTMMAHSPRLACRESDSTTGLLAGGPSCASQQTTRLPNYTSQICGYRVKETREGTLRNESTESATKLIVWVCGCVNVQQPVCKAVTAVSHSHMHSIGTCQKQPLCPSSVCTNYCVIDQQIGFWHSPSRNTPAPDTARRRQCYPPNAHLRFPCNCN